MGGQWSFISLHGLSVSLPGPVPHKCPAPGSLVVQFKSQLPNDAFWELSKFQFLFLGLRVKDREEKATKAPCHQEGMDSCPSPMHA